MGVTFKLSDSLRPKLRAADEFWIAVAMITPHGLDFILDNTSANCAQNFLLGIDLPTDPTTLSKLKTLQLKQEADVRLFLEKECFHPKVYLVKSGNTFS